MRSVYNPLRGKFLRIGNHEARIATSRGKKKQRSLNEATLHLGRNVSATNADKPRDDPRETSDIRSSFPMCRISSVN